MNAKQKKKNAQRVRDHQSAVIRHADYEAQQEKVHAPFGKTFKTGGYGTGKKDLSRKKVSQELKQCYKP